LHVMSAETRKGARKPMPEEVYRHIEESDMDHKAAMRTLRNQLPWKDWLVVDFLRYWYATGVLALLVFTVLGLASEYGVSDLRGVLELLAIAVVIAALGILGYRALWPHGGLTSREMVIGRAHRILPKKRRERFQ
jgi:hypothetical protein